MYKYHALKKRKFSVLILTGMIIALSGCLLPADLTPEPPSIPTIYAELLQTMTPQEANQASPTSLNNPSTTTSEITQAPSGTLPASDGGHTLWMHPGLSPKFISSLPIPEAVTFSEDPTSANTLIQIVPVTTPSASGERYWVYALVAPFYTLRDEISFNEIKSLWQGGSVDGSFQNIFVTASVRAAMEEILGPPSEDFVKVLPETEITAFAQSRQPILAIVPFEVLQPSWKVIRIDHQSPIMPVFDLLNYPLTVKIISESTDQTDIFVLPPSNYDPSIRTVLVMTGVTALVRATAYQMEIQGPLFPAQDILPWLAQADITHISNEVPFAKDCPYPDPNQQTLVFCSDPDYIELLELIGTDVVELSGNHLMDWGEAAARLSLEMYAAKGWDTYAGGYNLSDAQSPAILSHNGHHFAFIGCNPAGPAGAWATSTQPGSAPCGNYDWMVAEITRLKSEGYLPIVTFQYIEDYTAYPSDQMMADFRRIVDAGSVVVNGSQAHTPKWMEFYQDGFIHYGLGNLFFDQMEVYYNGIYLAGTRDEFIDRLVFYNGELISIELLTARLEDYARPRPMTQEERRLFLERIFTEALSTLSER